MTGQNTNNTMRWMQAVPLALILTLGAPQAPAAPASGAPTLSFRSGLVITWAVYGGRDVSGKVIGDYTVTCTTTEVSARGYRYRCSFTYPASIHGTQSVSAQDIRSATRVTAYVKDGDNTAAGQVSFLRLSDAMYSGLQAGKQTPFEFTGPDNPRTFQKTGEEDLTVLLNDRETTIHTLKARSQDGGTFWVLDDAAFPLLVKGNYAWKWTLVSVNDIKAVDTWMVDSLRKTGTATTHAILFAFNSAELTGESKPVLDGVAEYLRTAGTVRLEVQGHTDDIGGAQFNQELSLRRAQSVRSYLVAKGIAGSHLTAKGFGYTQPVADNGTPEGRSRNRRVVFQVLVP